MGIFVKKVDAREIDKVEKISSLSFNVLYMRLKFFNTRYGP